VNCFQYLLLTLLVYWRWWIRWPSARRKPPRIKIYLLCSKVLLSKVCVALRSSSVRDHFCTHSPLSRSSSKCCTGSDLVNKEVRIPYVLLYNQKHRVRYCTVVLRRAHVLYQSQTRSLSLPLIRVELTTSAIRSAGNSRLLCWTCKLRESAGTHYLWLSSKNVAIEN